MHRLCDFVVGLREDFLERHTVRIVAKGAKGLNFSHVGLGWRFQRLEKHRLYQPRHHNPKIRAPSPAAQFPARAFVACEDRFRILRDPPSASSTISMKHSTSQNQTSGPENFRLARHSGGIRTARRATISWL